MQRYKQKNIHSNVVYAEKEIKRQLSEVNKIDSEIAALYQDTGQQFLKSTVDEVTITQLKDKIFQIKSEAQDFNIDESLYIKERSSLSESKSQLTEMIQQISDKERIQKTINKIIVTPVIDWSVENHIVMEEEVDNTVIQQLHKEVSKCNLGLWKDKVLAIVNELVTQIDNYNSVAKLIEETENKLVSDAVTIDEVLILYDQVSLVKNDALRSILSTRLDNVYNQLIGEEILEEDSLENLE